MTLPRGLDYELPPERIAQHPASPRDAARVLVLERETQTLEECRFRDLPGRLRANDLLVVNDTQVVPAKLRGHKQTGGRAEVLLLERRADAPAHWRALVRCRGRLRTGARFRFEGLEAEVLELIDGGACVLGFESPEGDVAEQLLEQIGEAPLPPYIERSAPQRADLEDYQTVFARVPGAVAAPTASLHFTRELAASLPIATVTLHVGPGTFRPLRSDRLEDHKLEPERFEVPEQTARAIRAARESGGRVIAVGTTVVRVLEATGGAAGSGKTDLFVVPGYRFRVVDSLITNFHLPRSTLLALVLAFGGDAVPLAYRHAIGAGFRFYSYGDAMWIV